MLFILLNLIISATSSNVVRVVTSKGVIHGEKHYGYNSFLGVPYALVNVYSQFGASFPYPNFTKPFKANKNTTMCPQIKDFIYQGTLRCLTLNIYVPHRIKNSILPVLVWFHGESFWYGDANEYHSSHLVKHGIIFVSVNFRLGPFGFLCPKEHTLPGNQALRDQLAALKWINANINSFGGNYKSVTIAGSGYGGGYVDLHLYSTLDKPLFDKAIIQSGSIFSHGFFTPSDSGFPISIAKALEKSITRGTRARDIFPFLNKIAPYKILEVAEFLNHDIGVCPELKSTEAGVENFVTSIPESLDLGNKLKHTKILIGYNSLELLSLFSKNNTSEFYEESGDIIYRVLEKSFNLDKVKLSTLAYIIRRFYFGDKDYSPATILNLAEAMSDFAVVNGVERSINRFVKAGATVYKYLFSYNEESEYKNTGASQGDELKFLLDWRSNIYGSEQEILRQNMLLMWANFVKYGNPTPDNHPIAWTPLKGLARPYLNIDRDMNMMEDTFQQKNSFWHLLFYTYQNNSILF